MTNRNRVHLAICLATFTVALASGCSVATAVADSKQRPPVSNHSSKKSTDRMFTAATQAMGAFGKMSGSDRVSGVVQGQKGNWTMSAGISGAGTGSHLEVSARYVPSKQLDFFSREALTAEYVSLVEKNLGEKLTQVAP